eukprot:6176626-Pleurochrysis_carterae.AAC.1
MLRVSLSCLLATMLLQHCCVESALATIQLRPGRFAGPSVRGTSAPRRRRGAVQMRREDVDPEPQPEPLPEVERSARLGGQSAPGVDPYIDTLSVSDMSELARRMSSVRKNEELRAQLEAMPCAWVLVLDQDTEHEAVYSTTVGEDDERVVIAFEDDADAKNYAEGFQDKLLSESVEPATSVTLQALDLEALVVSSREADFRVAVVFKGDVYSQNEEDTDDEVGTGIDAHEESVDGSVGRSVARIFSDSGGMEQLSLDADLDDDGDDVDDDDDDDDFEEYFEFTLGGELPLITSGLRDIDADAGSWRVAYTVLPDEMFADKTSVSAKTCSEDISRLVLRKGSLGVARKMWSAKGKM